MATSCLRLGLVTAICLAGGAACSSRSTAYAESDSMIDSLFTAFAAAGRPGASVLVMRGDSVLVRKSYGLSDVASGEKATPETNYRLASLTKQFTAMATLLLIKDGRFSLDTPVRELLPELPTWAREMRVRHFLTHTSGIWDYEDFVPDTQTYQVKDADVLRLLRERAESTYFTPGSSWRYSNSAYALLALIVERASGERFGDFLKSRIFEPAGMHATVAHEEGRTTVARRAFGHTVRQDIVTRTDQSNTSAVLGDGGVYSSIDDLAQWNRAMRTQAIIDSTWWRMVMTPAVLNDGMSTQYGFSDTPTEYGFGWFIDNFRGHRRLLHHGETRGFTNAIRRFPDDDLMIVILTNRTAAAPWDIADRIAVSYLSGGTSATH